MPTLTLEQKKYWERLEQLLQEEGELYLAIKRLALEMAMYSAPVQVEEMVQENGVKIKKTLTKEGILFVNGKPRIYFPNNEFPTKEAYISHHRKQNEWADDPLLCAVLFNLGYQSHMHLYGHPDIEPYELFHIKPTGLSIDFFNFGAAGRGYHWERRDPVTGQPQSNPGGGNCGWHTLAQQVAIDIPKVKNKCSGTKSTLLDIAAQPKTATRPAVATEHATVSAAISEPKPQIAAAQPAQAPTISSSTAQVTKRTTLSLSIDQPIPAAPTADKQPAKPVQTWEEIVTLVQADQHFGTSKIPSKNEILYHVDLGNKNVKAGYVTKEQQIAWDEALTRKLENEGSSSQQEAQDHALALELEAEERRSFRRK